MVHSSFVAWVEAEVLPLGPRIQLDGGNVSSRTIVARFAYNGAVWQVHGDTHVGPVVRAYIAMQTAPHRTPFDVEWTRDRTGECLTLRRDLWRPGPKYFYVYRES